MGSFSGKFEAGRTRFQKVADPLANYIITVCKSILHNNSIEFEYKCDDH